MPGKREHDYDLVLRTLAELGSQAATAKKLGMLQSTVSKIARSQGIRTGKTGRIPVHALPMDEVASRYVSGETTIELGQAYGVDPEVIRRRLRTKGVSRRVGRAAGDRNSQWKGGYQAPMHYFRRQSYEVAAICLGRPLPQGWVIHHLDENPTNNAPENLVVFRHQSDHARFHQLQLRLQRTGQPVDASRLALENGAQALPPPPSPIAFSPDTDQRAL